MLTGCSFNSGFHMPRRTRIRSVSEVYEVYVVPSCNFSTPFIFNITNEASIGPSMCCVHIVLYPRSIHQDCLEKVSGRYAAS